MKKNENINVVNYDSQGNVIDAAFPVSERTKKDQSKTSVGYTLVSVLLHILAFVPIIAVSLVLAIRTYKLVPYYTVWPFVGVIVVGVFGLIYMTVALCVSRKKSKSSISSQTVKIAITFVCLTTVFALLLTYIVPDVIAKATQSTLFVEDLFYKGENQAEVNAKLDRDFIMYNLLNGNLNNHSDENGRGDFSYAGLSKHDEDDKGTHLRYVNPDIESKYKEYMGYASVEKLQEDVIDNMQKTQPKKYELYQFIYDTYVLNDFDYALFNTKERRAFALALVDYEYEYANYERLLKEGFKNKKIKQLFDTNFDNFNQDGYQPFDDPLLLYAQVNGRMTIPVVLRLILNEGWSYSQGAVDMNGQLQYAENGNFLYEMYDMEAKEAFDKDGGAYTFQGKLMGSDGQEYTEMYGFNKDGWMIFKNGVVKRPVNWLVLDMLGSPMDLTSLNINSLLGGVLGGLVNKDGTPLPEEMVGGVLTTLLKSLGNLIDAAGGLIQDDLSGLIQFATNGANLNICICIDDNGALDISISPMNPQYGMLGYMQASWVQSNNLLMAVINVMGLRNWLCIFGAVGVVLIIAAGICRECGKKTRMRTAVSRDRIAGAKTAERMADGEFTPEKFDEHEELAAGLTARDVAEIDAANGKKKPKRDKKDKKAADSLEEELNNMELTEEELALLAEDEGDKKFKKKRFGKKDKSEVEEIDSVTADTADDSLAASDIEEEEKPAKKKHFGKKNKPETTDETDMPTAEDIAVEEVEEKPKKKGLFGKKNKGNNEDVPEETEAEVTAEAASDVAGDVAEEEKPAKKKLFGKKNKAENTDEADMFAAEDIAVEEPEEKPKKKGLFGKKNKGNSEEAPEDTEAEVTAEAASDVADDAAEEEKPAKKKRFGKKNKDEDAADSAVASEDIAEPEKKQKKKLFGKKAKADKAEYDLNDDDIDIEITEEELANFDYNHEGGIDGEIL